MWFFGVFSWEDAGGSTFTHSHAIIALQADHTGFMLHSAVYLCNGRYTCNCLLFTCFCFYRFIDVCFCLV